MAAARETVLTPAGYSLLAAFAAVALVAIAVRGLVLRQLSGTLPLSTLILDGRIYDAWAQRIAAGDWLGTEVFYQAPLYPYCLAAIYWLLGHDAMLVRIGQAGLSVTACLLLASSGRRFFNSRTGMIAGLMLAIYPPAIFFDALVQKGALDLWLMTLLLALLAEMLVRRSWRWSLAAGLALGALTLNRENARVLYPVLLAWKGLYFRDVPWSRRAAWMAALTSGLALILLPVGARNYYVGGEFLLTTSQLGPNFFIGNHAGANGRYEPLVPLRGDPRFERTDATRLAEQAVGRKLSPNDVSRYWLSQSWNYIRAQPGDWLRLMARKTLLTFHATEVADSESIDVYAEYSWLLRGLWRLWHLGVALPLGVLGVWVTRRQWRELTLLYAMFLVLAAATALFYVFARYRLTLVPITLLFAAAALAQLPQLVKALRERNFVREWFAGIVTDGSDRRGGQFPAFRNARRRCHLYEPGNGAHHRRPPGGGPSGSTKSPGNQTDLGRRLLQHRPRADGAQAAGGGGRAVRAGPETLARFWRSARRVGKVFL